MKVSEIRPNRLMTEQQARYHRDVDRLMSNSKEFVYVECPACGGDEWELAFQKYGLHFVTCACSMVYANPRPTPAHMDAYYNNSENYKYWLDVIFPSSEAARLDKIIKPRVQRVIAAVEAAGVEPGLLMDIGAGFGTFCTEAQKYFKLVYALEPTLAEACRERGLNTIDCTIEQMDPCESPRMDVITAFEVIEHLFNPSQMVKRCFDILKPGGLLMLTCPNVAGFEIKMLGPNSDSVDTEHVNLFTPKALEILLKRQGFDVLDWSTPGELDVDLVNRAGLKIDPCEGKLQAFLQDNKVSSHLMMVAQKKC